MEGAATNYADFAGSLGLQPGSGGLFIGKIAGFPVGLKWIESVGAVLLLFQVRHWLGEGAPETKAIVYDDEVRKLVSEKEVQIEFDERLAWITFVDGREAIENSSVLQVLTSVLHAFKKAGLIGDPDLCHYCHKEKVDSLSNADGKVAQICPACLDERLRKSGRGSTSSAGEAVPIMLMTPAAAAVGALLWAGFWIAHTLFFEKAGSGTIILPHLIVVGIMVCIGLMVGGPVGWIIKQNRRRGGVVSALAAILFGSLAVVAGEVLYLAWLIYHEFQVFPLSAAIRVMPDYYVGNDPMFLAWKFMSAIISVCLAYMIAKPKESGLKF